MLEACGTVMCAEAADDEGFLVIGFLISISLATSELGVNRSARAICASSVSYGK